MEQQGEEACAVVSVDFFAPHLNANSRCVLDPHHSSGILSFSNPFYFLLTQLKESKSFFYPIKIENIPKCAYLSILNILIYVLSILILYSQYLYEA